MRTATPGAHLLANYARAPVTIVRGEGCELIDTEGTRYLDFLAGIAVCALGHAHPAISEAVATQAATLVHCSNIFNHEPAGTLADQLAARSGFDRVFFCNSGTEATEAAIKLARKLAFRKGETQRRTIVSCTGSFHGRTLGALAATANAKYHEGFEPLPGGFSFTAFNDVAALDAAIDDTVAAFIVEPVQGEGGVVVPPLGYLRAARELCDADGALLIADEVQTGLGRCAYTFACERDDVVPDVLVLAKGLSGGVMPIGAYVARPGAWNAAYAKAPLAHTSTFGGNPLACAAALAALNVLRDDDLAARSRALGERLLAGAGAIATEYPSVVRATRGLGLLVGVELQNEGYGGTIIPEMLKRGVTAAWTLNAQRVIRLEPPLIVTAAEIDVALEALRAGVAAAYESLGTLPETSSNA